MKRNFQTEIPLDSRQLNAFVTLVETGSFTEAARRLSLTQSAVSHSMRALESETHCRLLTRMGNTIAPTEAGEALLHYARLGLKEFGKGRQALEQLRTWGARRLRVGAGPVVSQYFLPGVLTAMRKQYPKLIIAVKTILSLDGVESLRSGEIACLIGEEPRASNDTDFTPLFQSPLRIVVHPSHRWPSRKRVALDELCREPCLVTPRNSPTRGLIDRALSSHKIALNVLGEIEDQETVKQLVNAGFGVGILPEWMVKEEKASGNLRVLPMAAPEIFQTLGLLRWRQRRPMDAFECVFRDLCLRAGKKFDVGISNKG